MASPQSVIDDRPSMNGATSEFSDAVAITGKTHNIGCKARKPRFITCFSQRDCLLCKLRGSPYSFSSSSTRHCTKIQSTVSNVLARRQAKAIEDRASRLLDSVPWLSIDSFTHAFSTHTPLCCIFQRKAESRRRSNDLGSQIGQTY